MLLFPANGCRRFWHFLHLPSRARALCECPLRILCRCRTAAAFLVRPKGALILVADRPPQAAFLPSCLPATNRIRKEEERRREKRSSFSRPTEGPSKRRVPLTQSSHSLTRGLCFGIGARPETGDGESEDLSSTTLLSFSEFSTAPRDLAYIMPTQRIQCCCVIGLHPPEKRVFLNLSCGLRLQNCHNTMQCSKFIEIFIRPEV